MKTHPVRLLALALWATTIASCSTREPVHTDDDTSAALRAAVDAKRPSFIADDGERGHQVWREAQRFYRQNGYQLAWSDGTRARAPFDALLRALHAADREGLEPSDYRVAELDTAPRAGFSRDQAVTFDLHATYAYLRYAWDLTRGTVDPEDVDPHWHATARNVDLHNALLSALGDGSVERSLGDLAPSSPQYHGLKQQLARARARGDAAAVQHIAMNMDRWRWLPDDLGSRYVLVNIPAFRLDVIENGRSVLDMKVVTGKKGSPTPVLADRMTTVVFSPYWNIPQDIVQKEILPKIEKDPDYLAKNNIEADGDSGHYRQRPGKGNSLGGVKFVFPNHFNVYLHDTPSQALFDRVERDFSHGCVRLDQPDALAQYVLRDQPEWTPEQIAAAMHSGTEHAVKLKQPLPIYLVYFTAWEEHGELKTVPDVYGLDRRHDTAARGQ
jgi:murein L,D-transpeptidase YcbB/YkuD